VGAVAGAGVGTLVPLAHRRDEQDKTDGITIRF
jgi:hypothetical protein